MCPIYLRDDTGFRHAPTYINYIPGWMETEELKWLYLAAQGMSSIVEVGSWKGKSTDALLSGCEGIVWAVDHFKGSEAERDGDHREALKRDISKVFIENVGHHKNLVLLKMDSLEAVKRFANKSVDMVFIDGGHEYEEVKADIEAWLPKTKKLICGHDYGGEIKQAAHEIFGTKINTMQSIWMKTI